MPVAIYVDGSSLAQSGPQTVPSLRKMVNMTGFMYYFLGLEHRAKKCLWIRLVWCLGVLTRMKERATVNQVLGSDVWFGVGGCTDTLRRKIGISRRTSREVRYSRSFCSIGHIMQIGTVTRVWRVASQGNVLAVPVSRLALARATFEEEARKLGATKFVRLSMAPEARLLLGELAEWLGELEEDGEPTSGTASSVAEVCARELRYVDEKGSLEDAATEPEAAADAARGRWGFLSGFCGAGSMSFSSAPIGGTPLASFDVGELVQRLWQERAGVACWGGFESVLGAARSGHLDWLKKAVLIYISGSPCPDYSKAGAGRGLGGSTARRAASGSATVSSGLDCGRR